MPVRFLTRSGVAVALMASLVGSAAVAASAATAEPPFVVSSGATIRTARGVPVPESGTEASLWSNSGRATIDLDGSGRVVVGAIGSYCQGWPIIQVTVDGVVTGRTTITSSSAYGSYPVGSAVEEGSHEVVISLVNDLATSTCDRNAHIGTAVMETPTSTPTGPSWPDATTTGVPDGTALTVHEGDLVIRTAGTVIDGLDVHGFVTVNADDVTIRNSVIRGGVANGRGRALIAAWSDHENLLIEDTTVEAANPSYYFNGIQGHHLTVRRVEVTNVVDSIVVMGDDVTIEDSWLHGNTHFDPDPLQSDGKSHDDGIQIEGGRRITVDGNSISGAYNAAIMMTQNAGLTGDVTINGNLLADGGCTVNMAEKGKGPFLGVAIVDNTFGATRLGCQLARPTTTELVLSGNVVAGGGELRIWSS